MEESADEGQVTPSAKRASLPTTPRSGLQSPAVGQDVGIEDSTPALRVRPCNLGTDDDDQDGRAPPHDAAGPRRPSGVGDDEDNGNAQFFDITEVLEIRFLDPDLKPSGLDPDLEILVSDLETSHFRTKNNSLPCFAIYGCAYPQYPCS